LEAHVSTVLAEQSETRAQTIVRTIEDEILSGRLKPRERLVETDLASRFGVSRAPVREALRMLEREGLITRGPQGLQVAEVSQQEMQEIFEVLAEFEELYTRRAVPHLSQGSIALMQDILEDMEQAAEADDYTRYFEANESFHRVLRDACPNRTLINLLNSLGRKTWRFRRMAMFLPGRPRRSFPEHIDILAAVAAGDANTAGERARRSATNAQRELLQFLQRSPEFV
jgi:DNA-binding GntR family transcriptional regulator